MNKKNPRKNRYQIFTILSVALGILNSYAAYNAYKNGYNNNALFNGVIALFWLLLAFYWYKKALKTEDKV